MNRFATLLLLISLVSFSACKKEHGPSAYDVATQTKPETNTTALPTTTTTTSVNYHDCTFSYKPNTANIGWTAFKTTDKVAVDGKFAKADIKALDTKTSITELINALQFEIDANSVSTNDTSRDRKIEQAFFDNMINTQTITGHIKDAEGNNVKGNCLAVFSLNNVEKKVPLKYSLENDVLSLTGSINILDFNANKALQALNKICYDLHKGADGVSKTWETVDLNISGELNKTCK